MILVEDRASAPRPAIPMPVSQISMLTDFACAAAAEQHLSLASVYFSALDSRLRIICSSRRGSLIDRDGRTGSPSETRSPWPGRDRRTRPSAVASRSLPSGTLVTSPAHHAGLDLVDVEQRVQHAGHGAEHRRPNRVDQPLLPFRRRRDLRQQSLQQASASAAAGADRGWPRRGSAISPHWPCSASLLGRRAAPPPSAGDR